MPDKQRFVPALRYHWLTSLFDPLVALTAREREFHVADWGKPQNALMAALSYPVRLLDGFARTRDNVQGRLPGLFAQGGFADVAVRQEMGTVYGTLTLYSGKKPPR